jgi:PAS domain S-box-containing protein
VAGVTQLRELGFELFELLPDAILAVDEQGVIQYANREAGRLFGQESATLVSAPVETLIPEHLRERHIADRTKYISEPRKRPMGAGLDLVARRADGTTFPVDIMLNPLKHLAAPMVLAVVRDMTERRAAEQFLIREMTERRAAEQLLMREINHRAKNMLMVVDAIARQTATRNPEDFIERFSERIQALSASQDLLVRNLWRGVDIHDLVCAQLAHFASLIDSRIAMRGPRLHLNAVSTQTIGLALHELATNAGRYGALSTDKGRVDIWWQTAANTFTMSWTENEGPPVVTPTRRGFGSTVINTMAKQSLGGKVAVYHARSGLMWQLTCPAANALEPEERE